MQPYERYQELAAYVGWTDTDARRVKTVGPLLEAYFVALIDDFYEEIERHPEANKVITGGAAQTSRLKQQLRDWLKQLFSGEYDREYVDRRWRVGQRHVDIGLNQIYTNAALSRLRRGLLRSLDEVWKGTTAELLATRASLVTLIDLDLAIIEDAYQTEYHRRQASAERLATIGKVAGGIAHELRNPLNVVKTSVYFLLNARNATDEKRKAHLERIERQVDLADSVITALNDFARLPVPKLEPVPVEACLRDAIEVNPLPKAVRVEWDVPDNNLAILCDSSQLRIVLGNIIRNARDAMPEGGLLRVSATQDDGKAVISVQDSGIGIPADALPHILEPLYSTKARGIGLGLSISHDIISRHHGTIAIASEPNVGTTVTLKIPTAR
jgi:signal transduction histidine kinase